MTGQTPTTVQPPPGVYRDATASRNTVTAGQTAAQPSTALSRRSELAHFLRGRRERISPEQVGIPGGGRRRTPGLRREEVAQLAGVGVTWYTWLEQGRDISVSESVLDAIARALLLDPHERSHLFVLGGAQPPPLDTASTAVPPETRIILQQLEPLPASLQTARYDILAFNRPYSRLFGDIAAIPPEDRNVLWLMFTDPTWRAMVIDWQESARRVISQYRSAMAEHLDEPTWKCLVNRLRRVSPEFVDMWDQHAIFSPESRIKRFVHPQVGFVEFNHTHLWMGPHHGRRLAVFTPTDAASRAGLEKLMAD